MELADAILKPSDQIISFDAALEAKLDVVIDVSSRRNSLHPRSWLDVSSTSRFWLDLTSTSLALTFG
jgi:hypothetical protein